MERAPGKRWRRERASSKFTRDMFIAAPNCSAKSARNWRDADLRLLICDYRVTHFGLTPFCPTMTGSSSIMYWVLPITPHIGTPVAATHFLDMLSPVWQPQLLAKAPLAKTRLLIFRSSSSCSHDLQALSMLLL